MTTSPTAGQHWEQPSFESEPARPYVTGPVFLPAVTHVNLPAPTQEEQTLRSIRRFVFPVALLVAILTGHWLPVLVLAIIVSSLLKRQLAMARYRRLQLGVNLR
jgi:hypothetical protein